ncbi:MAG: tail fiber domain-containing protein [Bryobacteraceae bacterium]|nr:tail fiber domain-containing protein [Bryobacteraceae bacterium]
MVALEPVSYTLKADSTPHLGLIAQDAEIVYPEVVHGKGEAMKAIDYAALVAPLIAAVKKLKAANDNLRETVEAQGRGIEALKAARP